MFDKITWFNIIAFYQIPNTLSVISNLKIISQFPQFINIRIIPQNMLRQKSIFFLLLKDVSWSYFYLFWRLPFEKLNPQTNASLFGFSPGTCCFSNKSVHVLLPETFFMSDSKKLNN